MAQSIAVEKRWVNSNGTQREKTERSTYKPLQGKALPPTARADLANLANLANLL